MARLDDLFNAKLERLDSVPDAFVSITDRVQQRLYGRLVQLMGSMDTINGVLVLNEANVTRISEIVNTLINEDLMQGEYGDALREYLREFGVQGDINDAMFAEVIDTLTVNPNWRLTIQEAQRTTLAALGTNGINQALGEPLRQQLNASISNSLTFDEAVEAIRVFVENSDEGLGRLSRHARQIAYDAFAFSERTYFHVVADDLDIQWFRYQGGVIRDTRDFCRERTGQIWHRSEIEKWAGSDWAGKAKGTDNKTIWSYAGGYNCRHSFGPVAASEVPDEVKARIS